MAAVSASATGLAAASGRPWPGTVAVAFAVLAGQLAVGWHNDWVDSPRDRAAGRLEKPIVSGRIQRGTVGGAAALAAIATIPLSFLSGARAGAIHLVAVASALSYNAKLKSGLFSALPYAVSFGLLPLFVVAGLPGSPLPPWWMPTATALLGTGAHLLNTIPDRVTDLAVGVRGLPQRLSVRAVVVAAAVLISASTATLVLGPGRPDLRVLVALGVTSVLLATAVTDALRRHGRLAFRLVLVIALLDVGVLLADGHRVG